MVSLPIVIDTSPTPSYKPTSSIKTNAMAEIIPRSDGTLNPSGVRFGSAEIYNIVEQFPEVYRHTGIFFFNFCPFTSPLKKLLQSQI